MNLIWRKESLFSVYFSNPMLLIFQQELFKTRKELLSKRKYQKNLRL